MSGVDATNGVDARTLLCYDFYDFKAGLNQDECFQRLHLVMNLHVMLLYSDGLKNFEEVAIIFRMNNTQEGRGRQSTKTVKVIKLERQKTLTANWHITKCLAEILQEVNVEELMLHHDIQLAPYSRINN
ncbi:hypothetical protein TNCV_3717111 [Trichonephila clavipes]|nr:hypothetical protein TNCV_3717111 [Trichonephila clavipes]